MEWELSYAFRMSIIKADKLSKRAKIVDDTHSANFDEKVHKPQSWCDASRTKQSSKWLSYIKQKKMLGI